MSNVGVVIRGLLSVGVCKRLHEDLGICGCAFCGMTSSLLLSLVGEA
jgi:hypothetical protein